LDYNNSTHSIESWDARRLDGWERSLECSLTWLGTTIGSVSRELGRQEVGNYSTNIGAYYYVLNDINVFHIILKGSVRIKSYIYIIISTMVLNLFFNHNAIVLL
jgi:hypothetical protein